MIFRKIQILCHLQFYVIFCETSKQQLKSKRMDETVKEVGQSVRKEIQEATLFSSWSPDPTKINYERQKIPGATEASFNANPAM